MKTLKQIVNQDERNAKILGSIINTVVTVIGAMTVIYGIATWAKHYTQFSWGIFTLVTSLTGMVAIFQTVKF